MNTIDSSMFFYGSGNLEKVKSSVTSSSAKAGSLLHGTAGGQLQGTGSGQAAAHLSAAKSRAGGRFVPENKELYNACSEFEALFIKQMLDSMRKTVERTSLTDSPTEGTGRDFFEDMLYDNYAKKMAETADLGIAKMMYMQLYRSQSQ